MTPKLQCSGKTLVLQEKSNTRQRFSLTAHVCSWVCPIQEGTRSLRTVSSHYQDRDMDILLPIIKDQKPM